jgi:hypothetical protein
MDMTGARLDHEERLDAPQGNRAAGREEITRQHRGCLQAQELPPGRAAALRRRRDPQPGFSRAICSITTTSRAPPGGLPPRQGQVHRQQTSRRGQRSSVSGVTSRLSRSGPGNSRSSAAARGTADPARRAPPGRPSPAPVCHRLASVGDDRSVRIWDPAT